MSVDGLADSTVGYDGRTNGGGSVDRAGGMDHGSGGSGGSGADSAVGNTGTGGAGEEGSVRSVGGDVASAGHIGLAVGGETEGACGESKSGEVGAGSKGDGGSFRELVGSGLAALPHKPMASACPGPIRFPSSSIMRAFD